MIPIIMELRSKDELTLYCCFKTLKGIVRADASWLLSVIGITNTAGRVACGYVADFPRVDSLLLNNVCLIMATLAVTATPFCYTMLDYVIMSTFFGIAICELDKIVFIAVFLHIIRNTLLTLLSAPK